MQLTALTTIITLLAASWGAIASPVAAAEPEPEAAVVEARAPTPVIDLYANTNYGGSHYVGSADPPTKCINLPTAWTTIVSSGKAKSGWKCYCYLGWNCGDQAFGAFINAPVFPGWIDNKCKSWKCVKA